MSRSLPEMGDWDGVFDDTYLQTYLPSVDPERTRAEARGAVDLAGVEPGAEILDCPTGFGRHAIALAEEGYRVTGLDRSRALLAEAESRRGDAEWPRLVRGDYRELPFEDASFDAVFNLFSSLGYLEIRSFEAEPVAEGRSACGSCSRTRAGSRRT
jgi:SAM-dependent methyltransferase